MSEYPIVEPPEIKIGDIKTFKLRNSPITIRGEIIKILVRHERTYIKLYSFFLRKELFYRLTKDMELVSLKRKSHNKKNIEIYPVETFYGDDEIKPFNPYYEKIRNLFIKIISIILIISILLLTFPKIIIPIYRVNMTFSNFLSSTYSIEELYVVVTNKIHYRYDMGENWITPENAWNKKYGDCEEFSAIISKYLTEHDIENYLIGLSIKNRNQGHAMVFAKYKGTYYAIDPTKAVEKYGIKKLVFQRNLKESVRLYTTAPAHIFKIPSYDTEKKILGTIY